jgi:hypothetical protein
LCSTMSRFFFSNAYIKCTLEPVHTHTHTHAHALQLLWEPSWRVSCLLFN